VKDCKFETTSWHIHKFCVACVVKSKDKGNIWKFISMHGSAYNGFKLDFINELHNVMAA
jgi:hypothetical protein